MNIIDALSNVQYKDVSKCQLLHFFVHSLCRSFSSFATIIRRINLMHMANHSLFYKCQKHIKDRV